MRLHANAALGLAGRRKLVGLIEQGHSLRAAAAALGVCPATAHRWWHRWARAGAPLRTSGACLADRSSAPHRQPRRLSDAQEAPILAARQATNLGPGRLAHICRRARSKLSAAAHSPSLALPADPFQTCTHPRWPTILDHLDTRRTMDAPSENHAPMNPSPERRCKASTNIADPEPYENLQSMPHRIPTARAVALHGLACVTSKLPTPTSAGRDRVAPSGQSLRHHDSST